MDRSQIQKALEAAQQLIKHGDFVIVGSLSVLGKIAIPPSDMAMSVDIDFYPMNDPGRGFSVSNELGRGSQFHTDHGYYLDAVTPSLPTLPRSWRARLVEIPLGEVTGYFLDVNDAAISKYSRGDENDYRWIESGINSNLLSLDTINARMRFETDFVDDDEKARAWNGVRLHENAIAQDGVLSTPLLDYYKSAPAPIREVNLDAGRYTGNVLWADASHAVQEIGRGEVVIHKIAEWTVKPPTGMKITVEYNDFNAEWEPKSVSRTNERGR